MARKRHYQWASEQDLASQVVRYLRQRDWTVYQEIAGIDMVAVKDDRRWAIECKRHWNLTIMAQTWEARKHAHGCSMAVPAVFAGRDHRFCLATARALGFGILQVGRPDASRRSHIKETVPPSWQTSCDDSLDAWLNPLAQDHAVAGSPAAAAWTPFKNTIDQLIELVQQQPGVRLSDALSLIDHHYATAQSARQQIKKLIEQGVIKELTLSGTGRQLMVYPVLLDS